MINVWLGQIAKIIYEQMWFAPLLALLAGVLTAFTPCALSNLPLIIGYVGGVGEKSTKQAFGYSVAFSVGSAVSLITLGVLASSITILLEKYEMYWHIFLGIVMVLMAFQTFELLEIIPQNNFITKNKKRGFVGAFVMGLLGGVFSSHCSTPVLVALLALVAQRGSILWGILLMFIYSVGHSVLVMFAGTSLSFVKMINESERYRRISSVLRIGMGIVILIIGLYMFYLAIV